MQTRNLYFRFQLKKMFQAGEGDQSNTGEERELATVVCSNMEDATRQKQTHLGGKDKSSTFHSLSPPHPSLFLLSLFIGAVKVCLHAHGDNLAERNKLVRQGKRRNF